MFQSMREVMDCYEYCYYEAHIKSPRLPRLKPFRRAAVDKVRLMSREQRDRLVHDISSIGENMRLSKTYGFVRVHPNTHKALTLEVFHCMFFMELWLDKYYIEAKPYMVASMTKQELMKNAEPDQFISWLRERAMWGESIPSFLRRSCDFSSQVKTVKSSLIVQVKSLPYVRDDAVVDI